MAADSLTPFLGLVKPVVGDEAGEDLWGDKLNANFDRIDSFASSQGELVEAPDDGLPYSRQSRNWSEAPTKEEVTTLTTKVTNNTAAIESLDTRMDANETIDTNQTNQIGSLGTQVGMQQSQIAAIESKNTSQDTAINGKAPLGPNDGSVYGWKGTDWFVLSGGGGSFTIDWNQVTGKPSTYPPTLPIPSSGVTGLDTKQTAQDDAIALRLTDSPNDGSQYARQSGNWTKVTGAVYVSDTPPAGALPSSLWWESDTGFLMLNYQDPNTTQWVMVNAAGMPEANKDGKAYARKDGAWFDLAATFATKADLSYVNTELAKKLNLTGGTVTGDLYTNAGLYGTTIQANYNPGAAGYALFANNKSTASGAGGVIGYAYADQVYGILGYNGSGTLYSLYGNAQIYVSGNITTGSAFILNGVVSFNNVANMQIGYGNGACWTVASNYNFEFAFAGTTRYRFEPGTGIGLRSLYDNTNSLGASSYRWTIIYATTGTINTSDENEKQDIRPLSDVELRVARALKPLICMYRWKDRVEEKGLDARIHCGIIAQRVQEAFAAEGLNAHDYGLFCVDPKVIYHHPVRDETTGEIIEPEWEENVGVRYGVRYDELAMFILGGL